MPSAAARSMDLTNAELNCVVGGNVFLRSAPTQNDLVPAPVSMITRTSSSSRASASFSRNSPQAIEFEGVEAHEYTTGATAHPDDRALAVAYAFAEQRKVQEAAARLDGSFAEKAPHPKDEWEFQPTWTKPFPPPPRLDGRRKK